MKIGCFALIEPFSSLDKQFELIKSLGVDYADLTDNHDGASLGGEYGFAAVASLDSHPGRIHRSAQAQGLTLTAVCAHANLLDPASPATYGTAQIIKAIRLANDLNVKQVITTEGDPKTLFGEHLSHEQRIFSIKEKLYWPVQWAKELGIELLIEPHGILSDTVDGMAAILEALGEEDTVGINLDTGNSWLGGGDPHAFVKAFGNRIKHVHWKDMEAEWESKRGTLYGCGMGTIPLGAGVVGIEGIVSALKDIGFDGPTTLEVAGEPNVRESIVQLKQWWS